MDKDLLNQFGWVVDSFDFVRDGSLDNAEAMFAMNTFGVMAEAQSNREEHSLYMRAAAGEDITLDSL